jgi:hypothetical protein
MSTTGEATHSIGDDAISMEGINSCGLGNRLSAHQNPLRCTVTACAAEASAPAAPLPDAWTEARVCCGSAL